MGREPRTPSFARTRARRGRLWLVALFAIAGALITLFTTLVPAWVRARVVRELESSGFVSPELRVLGIGPTEVRLGDVRLGPDLVIDEVDVGIDLVAREVESITLIGARWTVAPSAEAIEASTPARILRQSPGANDEGAPERVRIVRSAVVLGRSSIGVEGDVQPGRGRAHLTLSSPLGEHDVRVRVRPSDDETRVELVASSERDRARASVRLADDRVEATLSAQLAAWSGALDGHEAALAGISMRGSASLAGSRVDELSLRATSESARVDGVELGTLALQAAREDDGIAWRAQLAGGVDASISGVLPRELDRAGAGREELAFTVAGTIPAELIEGAVAGLEVSDVDAQLSGTAALERGAIAIEGVRGTLELASLRAPKESLALGDVRASIAGHGVIGRRVELELAPDSRIQAGVASLADLHARELVFAPRVRITAGSGRARITALEALTPVMDELAIGTGPAALRFERVRATIGARDATLVDVDGHRTRVAFHVGASGARVAGVLRGRGVQTEGELDASLAPGAEEIRLPLRGSVAELHEPESESSLSDARVSLPLRWRNGVLDARGRVSGELAWRDVAIGRAAGSIELGPDRIALAWRGPATRSAQFALTVGVDLGGTPAGTVEIAVPRTSVTLEDPISRVLASLTKLRIAGSLEGSLHMPIEAPARGRARIAVDGAEVAKTDGGGSARGVRGTLRFTRLDPVVSARSRVTWTALSLGDAITADAGSALLRFEAPRHLAIRDMEAAVAGGHVRLAPFRFDLDAPDIPIDMTVRGVELERVLAVTKGRVTGRGRLDGTLALRVKLGDEKRIVLGDGRLTARGPGLLRIADLAKVAPESKNELDAVMEGELIQQRVLHALADFRYRQLVLTVDEANGTSRVRARVLGRGAQTPQELDVALNLRGIQPLLDHALRLWPSGETTIEVRQHQ